MEQKDSKPKGWFSRRHATSENHNEAQNHHTSKMERKQNSALRLIERNERGVRGQIAELDKRLGKGRGARKERARLNKLIAGA